MCVCVCVCACVRVRVNVATCVQLEPPPTAHPCLSGCIALFEKLNAKYDAEVAAKACTPIKVTLSDGKVLDVYSCCGLHAQTSHHHCICCLPPSLSPSVKTAYTRKLLAHPHHPASKEFISSRYGIPLAAPRSLPTPVYRELEVETVATQPLTGPTVNNLVILTIAGSLCVGTVFVYAVVMPV